MTELGDTTAARRSRRRARLTPTAALRKLEQWVATQVGGVDRHHAGEARLASLLVEAGISAR